MVFVMQRVSYSLYNTPGYSAKLIDDDIRAITAASVILSDSKTEK